MNKNYLPLLFVLMLFSGCIAPGEEIAPSGTPEVTAATTFPPPITTAVEVKTVVSPTITTTETAQTFEEKAYENRSVAVEVDYRKYVDWFMNHNLNIRAYTPQEYVCGQYTADMINDSEKAGYNAYFAAVTFSDGTGHALVSFKSTFGYTSWYFFEPQTNNLMTPETLAQELHKSLGKIVNEVSVYGYFDDAGDKDPTTWRFAYPLYNKKY